MHTTGKPNTMTTEPGPALGPRRESGFRLGRWITWPVALLWLGILVLAVPLAGQVADVEDNRQAFLPDSAESTEVERLLPRFRATDEIPVVVVYTRDGGITPDDRATVAADADRLGSYVPDGSIEGPVPSDDGQALLLVVPLEYDDEGITDTVAALRADVASSAGGGLEVNVGGPAAALTDAVEVFADLDANLLLFTAGVVALLLLLTYRSPVLWLIPLFTVAVASQLAGALVYLLGRHAGLPVDGQSGGLLTVLVFGVGTDYALLLVARYREELHRHADRHVAMGVALRRCGPTVAASAGTVVLGLLCLLLADVNATRSLGGVGAVGIVAALVAMLTLLPALLLILGRWVFWPAIPSPRPLRGGDGVDARVGTPARGERSWWDRLATAVGRRPRPVWIGAVLTLTGLAFVATGLGLGLSQQQMFRVTPESVTSQADLAAHFPAGESAPTVVVVRDAAAPATATALEATPGVSRVEAPVRSADGGSALLSVILEDAPDGAAAEATVQRIRLTVADVPGAGALVGGPTALSLDLRAASAADRSLVIPLVLVVVLAVLVLLLRAVVAPLILLTTVVLSYFAALGAAAVVLDLGFGITALDHSAPLIGFVFLVALGVDYNIFLMSRVREEVRLHGHRAGVLRGLATTGGVITSAGLVLAATFAVLGTLPLVSLIGIGVLVGVGVLLDAFVVRSLVVPALVLDVGPRVWWPSRLDG